MTSMTDPTRAPDISIVVPVATYADTCSVASTLSVKLFYTCEADCFDLCQIEFRNHLADTICAVEFALLPQLPHVEHFRKHLNYVQSFDDDATTLRAFNDVFQLVLTVYFRVPDYDDQI